MSELITHHYTESGLPNVWIQCRREMDEEGQLTYIIPKIGRLHKAIAHTVVHSDGALTGAEIKFLRSEMGMTPANFGDIVHREAATVSRWERGEASPDGAMDTLIRMLAVEKLKLNKTDPAEISGKCKCTNSRKSPIRIDGTDPDHYRLVA